MTLPSWFQDLLDPFAKARGTIPAQNVENPPAFTTVAARKNRAVVKDTNTESLKMKKAWEIALAPAKSLPMNLFMSYMSGNTLQIVPITMTLVMFFINPLRSILGVSTEFAHLVTARNSYDIFATKLLFVLLHLCAVGAGIWKLNAMGLLPNTSSDWLEWQEPAFIMQNLLN